MVINSIKTLTVGQISLDLPEDIDQRLIAKYGKLSELRDRLTSFIDKLASHKHEYNINPYADQIKTHIRQKSSRA
jgi:hypothetical protein